MITDDKVTEIFCAVDEFCEEFEKQMEKKLSFPLMARCVVTAKPHFQTVK